MTARPPIVAALCWYDEAPEALTRCVESLHGFADVLVSLDGPYEHFPHVETRSPDEQVKALEFAARAARVPYAPLGQLSKPLTQAAKRTRLYQAAANFAGPNGWILIIDADETITGDKAGALDALRRIGSGFDSASVRVITNQSQAPHMRLIRAYQGITVGPEYHGMIYADDHDGRRVCLRDRRDLIMSQSPRPRRAKELDLSAVLTLTNDTDNRPDARKLAKREYVTRRAQAGIDL